MKDIRNLWKAHAATKTITREDIAALCLYRTLVQEQTAEDAKQKLFRSFSPISSPTKLANGSRPYDAMTYALGTVRYSVFAKWLDADDFARIEELAKETRKLI